MKKVSFIEMKYGTKEDYLFLDKHEKKYAGETADRIIKFMSGLTQTLEGYQVTRLEHSLQSATKAFKNGESEELVVAALLHDIGDSLAPQNHDRFSAEVVRPYLREEVTWVVEHHGIFQMIYYAHHYGWDKNARDRFKDNIYFKSCSDFCERWDQKAFDPNYESKPLKFFEPMIKDVFTRPPYVAEFIQEGVVKGLPDLI